MKKILALVLTVLIAASAFTFTAAAADENIVLGMDYDVVLDAPTENAYPKLAFSDPDKKLTDGVVATASTQYNDPKYVGFYRGAYANVTFDFGRSVYVKGFSISFYNKIDWGLYIPREILLLVSDDGAEWHTVASYMNNDLSSGKDGRTVLSASADTYTEARYVKLRFNVDVFSVCDELEITGTETALSALKCSDMPLFNDGAVNSFASNDNAAVNSIDNLILMYNGAAYAGVAGNPLGLNTYDELKPYAAYIGENGQMTDTMFDTFLFVQLNPGESAVHSFTKQSGWEAYLENTIGKDEDINMTALDRVVADMKTELSLDENYKVNVFMTVPYHGFSGTFGTLGTSSTVTPNTLEKSMRVIKWYIDLCIERFNESGFKNLNLVGFYWTEELIPYSRNSYAKELVQGFNAYVHENGYGSIWIPYYCAAGAADWKELGFDCATLQSGYAFPKENTSETGDPLPEACMDSMSYAKKYGLGVEFEVSGSAPARYTEYVNTATKLGCMKNGVTMYYQDGGPGFFYTASGNTSYRSYYDMTYNYIKKTYMQGVPELDFDGLILAESNGKRNKGNLPVTDADTNKSALRVSECIQPAHGKVSVDGDGFFMYNNDTDYIGYDSFSFSITDGFNISEMYEIQILVVDKLIRYSYVNKGLTADRLNMYTEGETTGTSDTEYSVYEVAVSADGKVLSAEYMCNTAIPEGGFVLSAAGVKIAELESEAKKTGKVLLDMITGSVCFGAEDEKPGDESLAPEESSALTSSEESKTEGGNNTVTVVIIVVAVLAVIAIAAVIVILKKRKK